MQQYQGADPELVVLLVDATLELPVVFEVTVESSSLVLHSGGSRLRESWKATMKESVFIFGAGASQSLSLMMIRG